MIWLHCSGAVLVTMSLGQVMAGGSVSFTVIVKEQVLELPQASVTVHWTLVVPTEKDEPDGGVQTTAGLVLQLSLAVGAKLTITEHAPGALLVVMFDGQVICGGTVSMVRTNCEQLAVFPLSSVAVHTRTMPLFGQVGPACASKS